MFRIALIGSGGMARTYRQAYAKLPGARWALAVDTSDEVLEECRALGVERVSKRFEDALEAGIDMVDVSTPNHLHAAQAVAAMRAGKHVILQKPISNTIDDADAIVAAARQTTKAVGMFMSSYTHPVYWEMRRMIERGVLGQVQSVRARDAHRGGLHAKKNEAAWRSSREKTGGGSLIQLSIHAINLLPWMLGGARITDVAAFSANQYCPNIGGDDVTTMTAKFDGGRYFGTFDSGYASEGLTREVFGTKGRMTFNENDHHLDLVLDERYECELFVYDKPRTRMSFQVLQPRLDDVTNPHNQHRQFVEAAMAGKPAPVGVEIGRHDLAVVMAAYESAQSGTVVKVR